MKAVIFDLDGTLVNSLEDLMDSTNYAMSKVGVKEINIEQTRQYVGNGRDLTFPASTNIIWNAEFNDLPQDN